MEYKIDNYRRMSGHILTTAVGHKYLSRKYAVNAVYLKCALFRDGCKATAKLDKDTDLITPGNVHNHDFTQYHSETYNLKKRCKIMARTSQEPLRKISMMRLERILLQLRYHSLNVNRQCIDQEGD